ncbi:MAG: hypothetical protein JWM05_2555 [Acidimicrobiales bacterium]|nr:hypothetical protein [Acidimicrobiales bacterium]
MHFEVSPELLAEVEERRAGGGFGLNLDWTLSFPVLDADDQWQIGRAQTQVSVAKSTWADLLTQIGVADALLLVVPVPTGAMSPDLQQAFARWKEGREALDAGRWRDAVKSSRECLDLIDLKTPVNAGPERTVAERWNAIGYAVHSLGSGAHHDDRGLQGAEWTRADAVAALAMTGSLLRLRTEERL